MKRVVSFLMAFVLTMSLALAYLPVLPSIADASYEQSLRNAGFPESYISRLSKLHDQHPTWQFKPVLISQMKSAYTWDYIINQEMEPERNLIYHTYPSNDYATSDTLLESGLWRQASKSTIEFFMDPRNFLDERNIFMFETLRSADAVYTLNDIQYAVSGTFMSNTKLENGKTYAQNFYDIGKATGVSALHLATRVKQEQGTSGTSPLISGKCGDTLWQYYQAGSNGAPSSGYNESGLKSYNGYYNYFNIGASGTGYFNIYLSGMKESKEGNWTTRYAAIQGGAQKIYNKYISDYQHTLYFQKFNVHPSSGRNFWGQYMQNVSAAYSEGRSIQKTYADNGLLDSAFTFEIPVYSGMPTACPDPGSSFEASTETVLSFSGNASEMNANGETNVTYKLTSNISGTLTLNGENISVDLAGHKWTNASNAIILATGTIYVYDSIGGGSIETTANDAINMGNGSAKFKDITIKGGGDGMDAIYCDGGRLIVENCTLAAPKAGINIANGSENLEADARAVVTVNGGKFANCNVKDSKGRNCAIEIRNNADEITLTGNISFENNKIISKTSNRKAIKDAITANATFTAGANVEDYVTATITLGGSSSGNSGNTGDSGNVGDDGNKDDSTDSGNTKPTVTITAGDINDDKSIDSKDVALIRRFITQWNVEINKLSADVNIDNAIDSKDTTLIRRYIAGWDIELKAPTSGNEDTEINISGLPTAGTFTAAGYPADQSVLNVGTGGTNDSIRHSLGVINLANYEEVRITYGNDGSAISLGGIFLKNSEGDLAEMRIEPSSGWKNTKKATFDVSSLENNEEIFIEFLPDGGNGIVITKIELLVKASTSSGTSSKVVNISSLSNAGTFTAAGYAANEYVLNMASGGENDSLKHSIGSHDLSKYNILKVTYGTAPGISSVGTFKLKDASGNVVASVTVSPSGGWKTTSVVELDVSKSSYNGALTLELANQTNGVVVTKLVFTSEKPDLNITIKDLPTSGTFTASGMSEDKYVLNFFTGGKNDAGKHSLGSLDLSGYNNLFITYGTAPVSSIGTLLLKDVSGNIISSVKLSPSGGWLVNSRARLDVSASSYSGTLYLEASSDVTNGFAISAITLTSKDSLAQSVSIGDVIIENAQLVADFARDNGFTYGHASINPGVNWASLNINSPAKTSERITSCDRFVDWVLYRSGFTQGQKETNGHVVFEMEGWLSSIGFTKITDVSQLQKGDVVFTTYDPTRPGTPAHVFLCASSNLGGNVYLRYDHGSNARIQCNKGTEVTPGKQPFKEVISDFYYAYRPYELG